MAVRQEIMNEVQTPLGNEERRRGGKKEERRGVEERLKKGDQRIYFRGRVKNTSL